MRQEPTEAEAALWRRLSGSRREGFKFRRQHVIDRFIVDFYCKEARLVVEVDGAIHDDRADLDAVRQQRLEALGIRVLRFTNEQVLHDLDVVIDTIERALECSPPRIE